MKIISLFFLLVVCFLTAAAFAITASTAPPTAVKPAWTTRNSASSGTGTLSVGAPLVVEVFGTTGLNPIIPTLIGSTFDPINSVTTICAMNPLKSGGCVSKTSVQMSSQHFNNIYPADLNGSSFLITSARHGFISVDAATATRWSPDFGTELALPQGYLPSVPTSVLANRMTNQQFVVAATSTGSSYQIVGGVSLDHKYQQTSITNFKNEAPYNHPNEAWGHDLTWIDEKYFAVLSLFTVYVVDSTTGDIVNSLTDPCGLELWGATVLYADPITQQLFILGSKMLQNFSQPFALCAVTLDISLTQIWTTTVDFPITYDTTSGVAAVRAIRSAYFNSTTGKTQAVDHLFITGSYGNTNVDHNRIFCFDITNQRFAWQIARKLDEFNSQPVLIGGSHDQNVAVSVNGELIGLNPVTQAVAWRCSAPSSSTARSQGYLGCYSTVVLFRDDAADNAVLRGVCLSQVGGSTNASTVVAFELNTEGSGSCTLKWINELPIPVDFDTQSTPAVSTFKNGAVARAEPFVSVLGIDGSIWTMSFRSNNE